MKENYCILCGSTSVDGKFECDHSFKKMCLNCACCALNEAGDALVCTNEKNLNAAYEKILEAANSASNGFKVDTLIISPLPLKKPTAKCGEWNLSEEAKDKVLSLFV